MTGFQSMLARGAFPLGDPVWRAPAGSHPYAHPYSYASHGVYGTVTEGARKRFQRFGGKVREGVDLLRKSG
ncbi:hypothetical protein OU995_22565 [Roseateles sp. SL47]|uniref:hypothetical protein n=1 Tax=Roseateles sp. SL47 TaxID=2995138 RepID=UPI00226FF52F|nr:hypothetical protein [Roseateles sp. SL47]WAC72315.1 hypothetical protein OU995_22565 [Roseateles sp. SL47]